MPAPTRSKSRNLAAIVRSGLAHHRAGRLREAEATYMGVLWQQPDHADALQLLGVIAHQVGQDRIAADLIARAIAVNSDVAEFHNNYGVALLGLGRADEATAAFRRAIDLRSKYPQAHHNLGNALRRRGELEAARNAYRRAVRLRPGYREAHVSLAALQLLRGDYGKGFESLAANLAEPPFINRARKRNVPAWDGGPLDGRTILLYGGGDVRDTVQLVRYAPRVRDAGGRVVVTCETPLAALLARAKGVDAVAPEGAPAPAFDAHAALAALPHLCATTLDDVPADVPYLAADEAKHAAWRERIGAGGGLAVGLAWADAAAPRDEAINAVPFERLGPLVDVPGVRIHALQTGDRAADAGAATDAVVDHSADIADLDDVAAAAAALDLVIAVDCGAAHVAGALGRPVWLMLPLVPDWRWLLVREDSPWYPTMRLFRQDRPGEWEPVVARVRDELAALAGGDRARLEPNRWQGPPATAVAAPDQDPDGARQAST